MHDLLERSTLPLVIVILVPLGLIAFAVWNGITSQGAQPAATSAPAAQTETITPATIALDDAATLPQTVTAAQLVPFSFSIQNTGDTSGSIPYKVYVQWSTGEEDVIDENVASLPAGASTTIDEELKFEIATETAEVYLELTQTGQTAQFALPSAQ